MISSVYIEASQFSEAENGPTDIYLQSIWNTAMASATLERIAGIALLAIFPVLAYAFGMVQPVVALAALNVVIIAASLHQMFTGDLDLPLSSA